MKFDLFFKENENKNINVYVDMDGVLAEYDIGNFDYETIRPIKTTINKIKELSTNKNIELYVLSICKTNAIVEEKYIWFDKHIPFFKKENLIFISKEEEINLNYSSKELKTNYLKDNLEEGKLTVLIDDDNEILSFIRKSKLDIKLFQDSSLID